MIETINQIINNNIFFYLGMVMVLLTAFAMTKQIFILDNIKTYSFQSFCLFLMNLALLKNHFSTHLLLSALIILICKVLIFPVFLTRVVKKLHVEDQLETLINVQIVLAISGLAAGLCFMIFPYEELSFLNPVLYHAIPLAVTMVMSGLLMMINRRKTISQIMGFLVMENGISLLVLFSAKTLSTVLELALAVDLLIGIIIMGIFSNKIKTDLEDLV